MMIQYYINTFIFKIITEHRCVVYASASPVRANAKIAASIHLEFARKKGDANWKTLEPKSNANKNRVRHLQKMRPPFCPPAHHHKSQITFIYWIRGFSFDRLDMQAKSVKYADVAERKAISGERKKSIHSNFAFIVSTQTAAPDTLVVCIVFLLLPWLLLLHWSYILHIPK